MQLKVHPLFFVLAFALVACGQALNFVWTFLALILHELGHAMMARLRGFVVKKAVLLPFGAMMSTEENFDPASSVMIGLAGPLFNLVLALITLGLWWLFPAVYPYTIPFFYANVSLCVFNLLPVYPLDGSRVVLGFCKNKLKAVKGLQIAGIVVSFAFFWLFIGSFFFGLNFTFGIIAVFLFYGSAFANRDEMYISVLDSSCKNYRLGVEQRTVRICEDTPIVRFYHHVSSSCETKFVVVDNENKEITTLDEGRLKDIALKNKLSKPIKAALEKNNQ